ncbi:MAG: DUF1566 domain-containing protein [Candidatus Electrothrix sp. Rat3]|nr:DUF1566 domain-containing protein [Candidatus Electrothrix rattekaaiensis]
MSVMAEQAEVTEKRYAILIASSCYPKEPGLKDLRCPENDVDALDAVLRSPDFGGFTKTFVFKNRPNHEVLERIETVLGEAGQHDLVLIYFSGHGKLNPAGQLCLATANTKLRALGSTSIQAAEIKSYFGHSASRKKILLLDCCYSGAVGKDFARGGVDDQLQLVSRGQGTFIMTASTGIEVAVEKEGDQYGLFTKHLVQGIRSGEADKNEDGFVDMQELYEYVHEKVRGEGAQKPMQWGLGVKGSIIIARSGRIAKEKWRQEMERGLHRFAADGLLTSRLVNEAIQVLNIPKKKLVGSEQQRIVLIEQLIDSRLGMADFMEQWMDLRCLDCAAVAQKSSTIKCESAERYIGRRYINHGDGTITDTKTGLIWKRCLEGLSGGNCEEGKVETYTWDVAVKRFKNVTYAGFTDWRLPTIDELKTLVYCSEGKDKEGRCKDGSEKPTINQQAFPNIEALRVWSGSPNADGSGYAWYVYFGNGFSYALSRSNFSAVRLVRDGQ